MPAGRPSDFTQEAADKICALISEGKSLRTIAKVEGMPSTETMYNWMRLFPEFLERYARAKEDQADAFAEEMLDLADDDTVDTNRSRLQIDTRKWLAMKLKPKKYGERITQEHTGDAFSSLAEAIIGKTEGLPE